MLPPAILIALKYPSAMLCRLCEVFNAVVQNLFYHTSITKQDKKNFMHTTYGPLQNPIEWICKWMTENKQRQSFRLHVTSRVVSNMCWQFVSSTYFDARIQKSWWYKANYVESTTKSMLNWFWKEFYWLISNQTNMPLDQLTSTRFIHHKLTSYKYSKVTNNRSFSITNTSNFLPPFILLRK